MVIGVVDAQIQCQKIASLRFFIKIEAKVQSVIIRKPRVVGSIVNIMVLSAVRVLYDMSRKSDAVAAVIIPVEEHVNIAADFESGHKIYFVPVVVAVTEPVIVKRLEFSLGPAQGIICGKRDFLCRV